MKSRTRLKGASLAGWLFADLAIVLSLVFLQSSIIGRGSVEVQESDQFTTTTLTPTAESETSITESTTGSVPGVSIRPCKIKFLSVPNLDDGQQILSNLENMIAKIPGCTDTDIDKVGVILVYAGNSDIRDDVVARENANRLCRSLYSTEAIDESTTYCEGFKNDGITSNYFDLTLFAYINRG